MKTICIHSCAVLRSVGIDDLSKNGLLEAAAFVEFYVSYIHTLALLHTKKFFWIFSLDVVCHGDYYSGTMKLVVDRTTLTIVSKNCGF